MPDSVDYQVKGYLRAALRPSRLRLFSRLRQRPRIMLTMVRTRPCCLSERLYSLSDAPSDWMRDYRYHKEVGM